MSIDRKRFLMNLSGSMFLSAVHGLPALDQNLFEIDKNDFITDANDEKYWSHISKKYYHVDKSFINLENGYFGVQSKPVLKAFQQNIELVNTQLARFARTDYPKIFQSIREEVSNFLNVSSEEIILTRNATEALNIAIQGYPFKQGDEVIINQLDYPSMIETFEMLEKRGRITIKRIDLQILPQDDNEIVNTYKNAITEKTKVLLLTHVSNVTGLIIPVAKIAKMAKEKNVDTIVDSAHALGQISFDLATLNSDFVGINLHKWIGNPIGAGVLYVKKDRIKEMQRFWGDFKVGEDDITKLAHYGTTQFAVMLTIPSSLNFHKQLGIERVSKRLDNLKSLWVNEFQNHNNIQVLTPVNPNYSCAIASFRVKNKTTSEVINYLLSEHRIFTVSRDIENDTCIRVTPSLYNSESDIKKLVFALNRL